MLGYAFSSGMESPVRKAQSQVPQMRERSIAALFDPFHSDADAQSFSMGLGHLASGINYVRERFTPQNEPNVGIEPMYRTAYITLDLHNNRVGSLIAELATTQEEAEEIIADLMKNIRIYEDLDELYASPPKSFQLAAMADQAVTRDMQGIGDDSAVRPNMEHPLNYYPQQFPGRQVPQHLIDEAERLNIPLDVPKYEVVDPRARYEHETDLVTDLLADSPAYDALAQRAMDYFPPGLRIGAGHYARMLDVDADVVNSATDARSKDALSRQMAVRAAQAEYERTILRAVPIDGTTMSRRQVVDMLFPAQTDEWWLSTPVKDYKKLIRSDAQSFSVPPQY